VNVVTLLKAFGFADAAAGRLVLRIKVSIFACTFSLCFDARVLNFENQGLILEMFVYLS
jgi:hypothetical protein